jgi:hypothetical protein
MNFQLGHDGVLRSRQSAGFLGFDARCCFGSGVESGRTTAAGAHEAKSHAGNVGEPARDRFSGDVALLQAGDEDLVRHGSRDGVDETPLRLRDCSLHVRLADHRHLGSAQQQRPG